MGLGALVSKAQAQPAQRGRIRDFGIEPGIFNGEIYYYSEGRKYIFKTCNPVEVELVSDPINDTIEVAITYEGDGLLVDFNRRTILDKDDPRATDITSPLE